MDNTNSTKNEQYKYNTNHTSLNFDFVTASLWHPLMSAELGLVSQRFFLQYWDNVKIGLIRGDLQS